jgi:hypothetical protein
MELQWTVFVQQQGGTACEPVAVGTFKRRVDGATPADFGLSLAEGRALVQGVQLQVVQGQINAYDARRRCCPHCGRYRRIKDWRPRTFLTALGKIHVRVPRVVACMCMPEPMDEDGEIEPYRESLCPIEKVLPGRLTPELAYLCTRHGASSSYRSAARAVSDITGLQRLSHMTVRHKTIEAGRYIEDRLFEAGWFAGRRKRDPARHLRVAVDSTVVRAVPTEEVTKFAVIAGRVERDGSDGRRFVCALPRRNLTRMLVAAALEQSGWVPRTLVDVVNDGAMDMRYLVRDIAPCAAPPMLDWFHLAMKMHAIWSSVTARTRPLGERPVFMRRCERLWRKIRNALWHGHAEKAIELTRMLAASLLEERPFLPPFYASCAVSSHGAATIETALTNLKLLALNDAVFRGKTVWRRPSSLMPAQ